MPTHLHPIRCRRLVFEVAAKALVICCALMVSTCAERNTPSESARTHWVGTWGSSPQLTESGNNPPEPGLSDNTLRQFVYTSIGGSQLRVQLSNEFGNGPVTLNSVHVATA